MEKAPCDCCGGSRFIHNADGKMSCPQCNRQEVPAKSRQSDFGRWRHLHNNGIRWTP